MTPMGWKYEDKAFTIYANMNKNMCDNAHRERVHKHTHIQTGKSKLQQQHDTQ